VEVRTRHPFFRLGILYLRSLRQGYIFHSKVTDKPALLALGGERKVEIELSRDGPRVVKIKEALEEAHQQEGGSRICKLTP